MGSAFGTRPRGARVTTLREARPGLPRADDCDRPAACEARPVASPAITGRESADGIRGRASASVSRSLQALPVGRLEAGHSAPQADRCSAGHSNASRAPLWARHVVGPSGVGRAITAFNMPIEGRDEWLAAARRLARGRDTCAARTRRGLERPARLTSSPPSSRPADPCPTPRRGLASGRVPPSGISRTCERDLV
jgi:hypothetical protein